MEKSAVEHRRGRSLLHLHRGSLRLRDRHRNGQRHNLPDVSGRRCHHQLRRQAQYRIPADPGAYRGGDTRRPGLLEGRSRGMGGHSRGGARPVTFISGTRSGRKRHCIKPFHPDVAGREDRGGRFLVQMVRSRDGLQIRRYPGQSDIHKEYRSARQGARQRNHLSQGDLLRLHIHGRNDRGSRGQDAQSGLLFRI